MQALSALSDNDNHLTGITAKQTVLVVDDDNSLREFLEIFLVNEGYKVVSASSAEEAMEQVKEKVPALVVSDIRMSGMDGVQLLKELKRMELTLPVILITAFASLDSAVEAMREGAWDYVTKPFHLEELREIIQNALNARELETTETVSDRERKVYRCGAMVAQSPAMINIFQLVNRIADSSSSVLITGESGTGKELVARAIHDLSPRKDAPFITVNCGGIPETLLESELFGHVRGAFTGADRDKKGLFALAHGGTIFLDEIGELPLLLQVKLLRAVQQKSFIPVGGTVPETSDCRIIAATNRDLEEEVMKGEFREDLYYRLNVLHLHIPPLRERKEDIPLLVQYFFDKYGADQGKSVQGISRFAMEALMEYHFPGNVRELENIIERSVALSSSSLILPESLSLARFKQGKGDAGSSSGVDPVQEGAPGQLRVILPEKGMDLDGFLEQMEKDLLTQALERCNGRKKEAARLLGLNFRSFRYRVAKYELG